LPWANAVKLARPAGSCLTLGFPLNVHPQHYPRPRDQPQMLVTTWFENRHEIRVAYVSMMPRGIVNFTTPFIVRCPSAVTATVVVDSHPVGRELRLLDRRLGERGRREQ
jgi:hypothetical protein